MILPIVGYGSAILRQVAEPVSRDYPELGQLIDDMFETVCGQRCRLGSSPDRFVNKDVRHRCQPFQGDVS